MMKKFQEQEQWIVQFLVVEFVSLHAFRLRVPRYGKCRPNADSRGPPGEDRVLQKRRLSQRHLFAFAAENAVCDGERSRSQLRNRSLPDGVSAPAFTKT